jgi:hypothetical protein
MKVLLLGIFSLILAACGGGDETSNTPSTTQVSDSLSTKIIVNNAINAFDDSIATDQAVELFLYYPSSEVSNITWTQTAGEAVTLLTPNDKGIAFTPSRSGSYSFEVTFTTANNTSETLTHEINVTDEISSISARLGHVVSEGNKVSLRTNLADNLPFNSIDWQQTSGPEVILTDENTTGKTAIFFDAPPVDQDTFITFEVSASSTNSIYQDTVAVLIENKSEISPNAIFDERVSNTFTYNGNSPYKNSLVDCVYSNEITINNICTLNKLPLIAHDTLTPTVDEIMDRVVVSHQWMGDRFKEFLEIYDIHGDLKNMLRATTAIVISYDIRPSFYWAATGAIYLDANNFWLSVDERDTLNEAPDYRASFGNDLQFDIPWRYVKDNSYLSTFISEDTRISREVDEGVYSIIGLMYHELAHANDFFPKSSWFNLDRNKQIIAAIPNTIQSDILSQIHPLHGNEMLSLAQVNFSGFTATETEKSFTPQDITQLFSIEAAPQFYNYSSIKEDYAMLFDVL